MVRDGSGRPSCDVTAPKKGGWGGVDEKFNILVGVNKGGVGATVGKGVKHGGGHQVHVESIEFCKCSLN